MDHIENLNNLLADARTFAHLAWMKARELNEESGQTNESYRMLVSKTSAAYDMLKRAASELEKLG